ncbi:hypothetical protein B0H14DRAFT_3557563 [Mycena olivaceomarginata]|nr:hypothetical protein B0H14DRAFT_3557563 [Mycena olivaceomarginata]
MTLDPGVVAGRSPRELDARNLPLKPLPFARIAFEVNPMDLLREKNIPSARIKPMRSAITVDEGQITPRPGLSVLPTEHAHAEVLPTLHLCPAPGRARCPSGKKCSFATLFPKANPDLSPSVLTFFPNFSSSFWSGVFSSFRFVFGRRAGGAGAERRGRRRSASEIRVCEGGDECAGREGDAGVNAARVGFHAPIESGEMCRSAPEGVGWDGCCSARVPVDNDDDELMIDTEPSAIPLSSAPVFAPLPADTGKTILKLETRRIAIPPHRMMPLKKEWINVFGPLTEILGLQVRMNVQRKCVQRGCVSDVKVILLGRPTSSTTHPYHPLVTALRSLPRPPRPAVPGSSASFLLLGFLEIARTHAVSPSSAPPRSKPPHVCGIAHTVTGAHTMSPRPCPHSPVVYAPGPNSAAALASFPPERIPPSDPSHGLSSASHKPPGDRDTLLCAHTLLKVAFSHYFPDATDPDDPSMRDLVKAEAGPSSADHSLDNELSPLLVLITRLYLADEVSRMCTRDWLIPADLDRSATAGSLESCPNMLSRCPRLLSSVYHAHLKDSVKRCNVTGFLFNKGIINAPPLPATPTSSASLSAAVADNINPVAGTVQEARVPEPEMMPEEKEREMEKLFVLFNRLERTGTLPPSQNPIWKAMEKAATAPPGGSQE